MRDFIIEAIFDPGYNQWIVVQVWRDGNPHELCRFGSEDDAYDFVSAEYQRYREANSKFGVGA